VALSATILRFTVDLSDVDRGKYEQLEFRVARHPSESNAYLLARVIAYLLNVQEGIAFTDGISSPDDPAVWVKDLTGALLTWIDVGNPSARRLHKASKAARNVRIYTYRDPQILLKEIASEKVHRSEAIEIFALPPAFISELEQTVAKDNDWRFLHSEGDLSVTVGEVTVEGEVQRHDVK
jgi:uncharacterized protein YaeQ